MRKAGAESMKCRFSVKESGYGDPLLSIEPCYGGLTVFGGIHLMLVLQEGTTLPQAQALADRLNDEVFEVGCIYFKEVEEDPEELDPATGGDLVQ